MTSASGSLPGRRFFNRLTGGVALAVLSTILVRAGVAAPPASDARLANPEDRYALAGGCYAVRSLASGAYLVRSGSGFGATAIDVAQAEPFHFQATDLGSYLLFGSAKDFFAAQEGLVGQAVDAATSNAVAGDVEGLTDGVSTEAADTLRRGPAGTATGRGASVVAAAKPSELADWTIDSNDAASFTITLPATSQTLASDGGVVGLVDAGRSGPETRFGFELTTGCAEFPEAEVNVDGPVATGDSSFAEVRGFLDAHVHMMAYEFLGGRAHCARPWHRFGVEYALVDCSDHEPGGIGAALEQVLTADSQGGHDTAGWPTFPYWPRYNSLTHEQTYYKWLERAWHGGLRMMTNLLVDNHALCMVYPLKRNSCNEMDGVRLQAKRIHELERYIDAQSGGPGEGWFRIVTDPFQARRVMNDGKLAVVLGIEVSTPFNCGLVRDATLCTPQQIDAGLSEVYDLGVRQMEMTNKFDNGMTGVTGDAGSTGVVVNGGNATETGSFWQMKSCDDPNSDAHDMQQYNFHDESGSPEALTGRDSIMGGVLEVAGQTGAAPVYPAGPHCNIRGLTDLGKHFLQGLMSRGMMFDPDHMSALARAQAMDVVEAAGYSGVVSSHSWADDTIYPRVIAAGGIVTPHAGSSRSFIASWERTKAWADPRYPFAIGYGSDVNGLSVQGAPRGAGVPDKVTYPFTGFGGVTVSKQVSGQRVYDVNTDGVAHYGLYPDWLEDLRLQAGQQIIDDMARGPEGYLESWERAIGIAPNACRSDVADLTDAHVSELIAGMSPETVVRTIGQPGARTGTAFDFCMTGSRTAHIVFADEELASVDIS